MAQSPNGTTRPRNGRICFFHPNGRGNGCAVRFELRLNRGNEQGYDCIFLEMAEQKSPGSREAPATFDWSKKAAVKLDFHDICRLLAVLEGKQNAAGENGRGIYHQTGANNTILGLKRKQDDNGFLISVSRKSSGGEQIFKAFTSLSEAEGIGLRSIFQSSLFYLAFLPSLKG